VHACNSAAIARSVADVSEASVRMSPNLQTCSAATGGSPLHMNWALGQLLAEGAVCATDTRRGPGRCLAVPRRLLGCPAPPR